MLDTGRSDPIQYLHSKLSSKGRFSVAASSRKIANIFKLNFGSAKKTLAPTSRVEIHNEQD